MKPSPVHFLAPAALTLAISIAGYWYSPHQREQRRIASALSDCRAIIRAGEQGWGDEVGRRLCELKRATKDQSLLARRLLAESDGSLAAEGMVIVAEQGFSGGDHILAVFARDKRSNYWLDDDAHWSRLCLAVWKAKTGVPLDEADRRAVRGYDLVLRSVFGLTICESPNSGHGDVDTP